MLRKPTMKADGFEEEMQEIKTTRVLNITIEEKKDDMMKSMFLSICKSLAEIQDRENKTVFAGSQKFGASLLKSIKKPSDP